MAVDPSRIPGKFAIFLPLARKWDIGDDYDRERAVRDASTQDLTDLLAVLKDDRADELYDWLAGPESYATTPSIEYLALTHLTMAADSAKLELKRRGPGGP